MEKKEIIKQLELLKDQIGDLQGQLKEVEKPKFEVGKWYKDLNNHGVLCCFKEIGGHNYGFTPEWGGSVYFSDIRLWTEATNEEVKARLIEYWEKDNEPFERYNLYNNIFSGTNNGVFYERLLNSKGEWVHSNPKKRTLTIEEAEKEFNVKICK